MHVQKPEEVVGAARPFTGAQYLESLRDGREVYIYGERVEDVTTHPAFRNTARSIARLYDALHDPQIRDLRPIPAQVALPTNSSVSLARAKMSSASVTQSPPGPA